MIFRPSGFAFTLLFSWLLVVGLYPDGPWGEGRGWAADQPSSAKTRPNILFAIADDWGLHAGAYGTPWVKTPTFDRIAREGILFQKAFTPMAKCAPSRAILLTGRHLWQNEEAGNHMAFFPSKLKSWPEVLAESGWHMGITGKGWGPGVAQDAEGKPRQMTGKPFNRRTAKPTTDAMATNDYAANFVDFLEAAPEGKPWCFWYGAMEPHRGYEFQSGVKKGGKRLSDVDRVPDYWPDHETVRHDILDYALEVEHVDLHLSRMVAELERRKMLENTVIIVTSDHGMPFPRAKGYAYLDSNHVPLAIRWPAGIRKAGRSIDDFVNFTDIAPTILDLAGIDPKRSGMQPITGKSLRPILDSDRSGRVVPERDHTLVGKERTDVGRPNDEGYPIRGIVTDTHLFLKNYEATRWPAGNPETGYLDTDGSPTKTLILERGRQDRQDRFWQLNFGMRPQRELYDLVRDRDCSRNQADSMAQASVLAELEKRMEKELLDQGDPRMKGEGQIFDRYLPTNGAGFYEKFQRGEKVNAGWVSPTDFEKSPLPKPTGASKSNSKPRPNIIVVMCDDVGYSDIGCFGGEIRTPTLDGLAAGGLRFTQFYNTARCCPTRATLLTGLYAHQAGIGHMVDDFSTKVGESYAGDLSKKAVTIAEVLKPAGYSTYMAGKWHVTKVTRPANDSDKHNWPLQRGFDRFYGTIHGAGSFYDPNTLVRDNAFVSPFDDPEYRPELFYYTDAINDHAARFVNEHHARQPDKPFFLYMAHTAAHWPMHAKEIDIARYRGRYDGGYDPIRAARIEKMKQLGLIDVRWQIAPQVGQWSEVKNKVWEARCMEVYAAMLDCMDQGLARLVDALKRNGQFENTLILYLQDNGGCAEGMGRGGAFTARSDKPTMAPLPNSYLQPDMIPKQTRDGFPVRQGEGVLPGPADTYIGYGRAWANVSNTPFREYKHWQHEGGISSPLIAHWPDGISGSLAGQLQSQPAHLIDLMATCVDLADAEYPTRMHDQTIQPMEGVSLQPAFSGDRIRRNNPIFWEHEGNRAVRQGDWKLVSKHPGPWELYNLADDRAEMNDLSQREPSRVAELSSLWDEWSKRVGVAPWPLKATAEPKRN